MLRFCTWWIPCSVFRVPCSVFRIPYSVFRVPYSVFRILYRARLERELRLRPNRRLWLQPPTPSSHLLFLLPVYQVDVRLFKKLTGEGGGGQERRQQNIVGLFPISPFVKFLARLNLRRKH
jgi:hypothetical protein